MKEKRKLVHCQQCKYLLLIKREKVLALCVAKAKFSGGALRNKVNIKGIVLAESRNLKMNCRLFRWKWLIPAKLFMRNWIRRDLNVKKAKMGEYPIEEEEERERQFKEEKRNLQTSRESSKESSIFNGGRDLVRDTKYGNGSPDKGSEERFDIDKEREGIHSGGNENSSEPDSTGSVSDAIGRKD